MLNSFDILIYASTTQKVIWSFELSPFSYIPSFIYQLIVKSMWAFVHRCLLFLWSVEPFYFRMTRRNKLQYLIQIQDWVKVVVFRRSKCQSIFCSVLPWSVTISYRNCTISYESWRSDTSCHHFSFLGTRVMATGMPTSEPWCVESILLATVFLGS